MTLYPNIIYHPDSETEIFIDSLQQIDNRSNANIVTFQDSLTGDIRTFDRALDANSLTLYGKVRTTNAATLRRQLQYLRGKQVYVMLGAQGMAARARIQSFDMQITTSTYPSVTIDLTLDANSEGYFWEAEALTTGGVVTSDSNSSMGAYVELDGLVEYVYEEIEQSDSILAAGNYVMFARAADSNQVASDFNMRVKNVDDSTFNVSEFKTLTGSYAWYFVEFTIGASDAGDTLQFAVLKGTATTNEIKVDCLGFVRI